MLTVALVIVMILSAFCAVLAGVFWWVTRP